MNINIVEIETKRLILRQYRPMDLNDYIEHKNNTQLYQYMPGKPKDNIKDYKKSLKTIIKESKHPTGHAAWIWAIALKQQNKVVGNVSIQCIVPRYKLCEIGWSVNINYQNQGYACEASEGLINHIFNTLDINRIEVYIWQGNEASKKLATKLGFVYEGCARQSRIKDGKTYDVLQYSLLKDEWEKLDYCSI